MFLVNVNWRFVWRSTITIYGTSRPLGIHGTGSKTPGGTVTHTRGTHTGHTGAHATRAHGAHRTGFRLVVLAAGGRDELGTAQSGQLFAYNTIAL